LGDVERTARLRSSSFTSSIDNTNYLRRSARCRRRHPDIALMLSNGSGEFSGTFDAGYPCINQGFAAATASVG
jgi:hypothetical protein